MCLVFRRVATAIAGAALLLLPASLSSQISEPTAAHRPDELWVCADPNNLPFSNARGEGFENRIATLVAGELHKRVRYFWQPQRRGFVRTTLSAHHCDLIMGVPVSFDPVETTSPYYRSSYVFVTQAGRQPVRSFDDPRLARMRIGIQLTGEDYENPPPAVALARRQLSTQVRGFMVYGDYSVPSPQRAMIDAVANGAIDVAVGWGPLAGYFASLEPVRLALTPVPADANDTALPFAFDIAMGVRHGDHAFLEQLNYVLALRRGAIDAVLRQFHVPLLPRAQMTSAKLTEGTP